MHLDFMNNKHFSLHKNQQNKMYLKKNIYIEI